MKAIDNIDTWDELKAYFKQHKDALEFLSEYEGLDGFLGSGNFGRCFKIKNSNLVMKITTDREEIKHAEKLVGKDFKTLVHIYKVHPVANYKVGIIILEMLYTVDTFAEYIKRNKDYWIIAKQFIYSEIEHKQENNIRLSKLLIKLQQHKKFYEFCLQLVKDLRSLRIKDIDFHLGNILEDKDGNYKLIDV